MSIEERFRRLATEQEFIEHKTREAYGNNLRTLHRVNAMVLEVLNAFCSAIGWSLERNSVIDDKETGHVACYYDLRRDRHCETDDYILVAVEVGAPRYSSPACDPRTRTLFSGVSVTRRSNAANYPGVAISLERLSEDSLAALLEEEFVSLREEPATSFCVYCGHDTVHRHRADGYPYCLKCGRRVINIELYCSSCRDETVHYEYGNDWKCIECGHVRRHG